MDGTILVNSQKNKGTIFTVEFDLPIGSSQNVPQEVEMNIDPAFLKTKTILLVEDNEMNRILARTILQTYQVQLIEVENGLKAVEMVKQQHIDLILMDIQMPVMDGIVATQHIRNSLKRKTPILALTANALKGEREKCLAAGMNEYISKPFREKELINTICKLLDFTENIATNNPLSKSQEKTTKRPYSFDYLNETSGNSADFVKEMVDIFINEAQTMINKMPILLENQDFDAVRSLAHKFKSNLYMLEINDMAQLAQTIEHHKENNYSDFQPLVDELVTGTQNVLELLSLEVVG
jgi:CheY-like chemotaxis protein